jgi:hypothetical protein
MLLVRDARVHALCLKSASCAGAVAGDESSSDEWREPSDASSSEGSSAARTRWGAPPRSDGASSWSGRTCVRVRQSTVF